MQLDSVTETSGLISGTNMWCNFGRFIRCTPAVHVNPVELKYAAMELGQMSISKTQIITNTMTQLKYKYNYPDLVIWFTPCLIQLWI